MAATGVSVEMHRGDQHEGVATASLLERVRNGEILVVRRCLQVAGVFDLLLDEFGEVVERDCGRDARISVQQSGVDLLHTVLPVDSLGEIVRSLAARFHVISPRVVSAMASALGLDVVNIHYEDRPNVRIMIPHDLAASHAELFDEYTRDLGAGKLTGHGPHQDFWHYHPMNAINVWCALGSVARENGMLMYPERHGQRIPSDEDKNVRSDQYFGKPVDAALEAGDALVFDAHHVHTSVINQTARTRFVVSFRITPEAPAYWGKPWYNYVRPADCTEAGPPPNPVDYSAARPEVAPTTLDSSALKPAPLPATVLDQGRQLRLSSHLLHEGEIRPVTEKLCAARIGGKALFFDRFCPHQSADLAAGFVRDRHVVCAWHGVAFDSVSGRSRCEVLAALRIHPSVEKDGQISVFLDRAVTSPPG